MNRFEFVRVADVDAATIAGARPNTRFLAGGTNLVDLMKENVERPDGLIDINHLPLSAIEDLETGGLRLGALATNANTAYDPRVAQRYPVLSSAILSGASPQLRNAATNGGNLNQRTRCYYFYDLASSCNKRAPGSGCDAIGGLNRIHAILGASDQCVATHPSDMCVALAVLEPTVQVIGTRGTRGIPFADYHRLPGKDPSRDNTLDKGDLVTAIDLPPEEFRETYTYLKLRDRLSYAFALVSVAVVMKIDNGLIAEARVALGGVAHKPWRMPSAEELLKGQAASEALFDAFAHRMMDGAVGLGMNNFKIPLARKAVVRALIQAAGGRPQSPTSKAIS